MIAPANPNEEEPETDISVHPKKAAMLAAYAKCGVVARACKFADVGRTTHYEWLNDDAEYRAAFSEAHKTAIEYLESVAHRRATKGWLEPVFHKGAVCGHVRRFSDTLLIFMLKGAAPDKYRDRMETKHSGQIEHNHTVEDMRAIVEETCRDETYVRLQRQRAAQYGSVAGSNGHNGDAGPMANGETPGVG